MLLTMERHICLNGVVCEALREEHVVFLASPALLRAHGVEDGEPVGVDALARLPFVLTERGESYRLELDRLLAERDVTIEPLVEACNTETLVHLAERGVGGNVRAAVLGCQRARIGDARGAWERHAGGAHGDPDALARAQVDRPAPGGVHPGDAAVLCVVGANDAPGQMAPGGEWCPGVSGASERVHRSCGRPTRRRAAGPGIRANFPRARGADNRPSDRSRAKFLRSHGNCPHWRKGATRPQKIGGRLIHVLQQGKRMQRARMQPVVESGKRREDCLCTVECLTHIQRGNEQ